MPLSTPAPREPLHTRRIECRGFKRADGLFDIEAQMTDVKTYTFTNRWRGDIAPGTPLHQMWIRVTLDHRLTIVAIEAVTDHAPFRACPEIAPNFQRLTGLRIGPGFRAKIKELVGGTEGCTHLVELMGPIATTAFQTMSGQRPERQSQGRQRQDRDQADDAKLRRPPPIIDTCHAFASDGEVVREELPEFYTGDNPPR
jgi:Protein of unknown function (DUF2889)